MASTGAAERRRLPLPGILADGAARPSGDLRCLFIQCNSPDWQVSSRGNSEAPSVKDLSTLTALCMLLAGRV